MSCVCNGETVCQHHASGGMLAIAGWFALGFVWAAFKDRVLRRAA